MSYYLVMGHFENRDPDWSICQAESADEAVNNFASGMLVDEALSLGNDEDARTILNYYRDGELEEHGYPELYIDHVFKSESPIHRWYTGDFPGGRE